MGVRRASIRSMRTTLDIADDVLVAIEERARKEKRSAGEILSEVAREALTLRLLVKDAKPECFFGFEPFPPRGEAVTNERIDELREKTLD